MSESLSLDAAAMRSSNTSLVLQLLWQHQSISRAELARLTGMSRPSISALVAAPLAMGLISEQGHGHSSGGRRPVMLRFEDEALLLAGLDFAASHVSLILTNLRGQEVKWLSQELDTREQPEQAISCGIELYFTALEAASREGRKIAGLGVGISSPVYGRSPGQDFSLHPSIHPRWVNHQLGQALAEKIKLPILFDNDANLGALAEYWWTLQRQARHLLYLKVGSGLGAGLIVDGQIFSGAHGLAGELGHSFLSERPALGPPTSDNVNALIGVQNVLARMPRTLEERQLSPVLERGLILRRCYQSGDPGGHVKQFLHRLSLIIVQALVSFDPEQLFIGGVAADLGEELFELLRREVRQQIVWPELQAVPLRCSRFGEKQTALGAATRVLDKLLKDWPQFGETREPLRGRDIWKDKTWQEEPAH